MTTTQPNPEPATQGREYPTSDFKGRCPVCNINWDWFPLVHCSGSDKRLCVECKTVFAPHPEPAPVKPVAPQYCQCASCSEGISQPLGHDRSPPAPVDEAAVRRNAEMEALLKRWCQCPEVTEIAPEDLDPETDQVWRETRALLASEPQS